MCFDNVSFDDSFLCTVMEIEILTEFSGHTLYLLRKLFQTILLAAKWTVKTLWLNVERLLHINSDKAKTNKQTPQIKQNKTKQNKQTKKPNKQTNKQTKNKQIKNKKQTNQTNKQTNKNQTNQNKYRMFPVSHPITSMRDAGFFFFIFRFIKR